MPASWASRTIPSGAPRTEATAGEAPPRRLGRGPRGAGPGGHDGHGARRRRVCDLSIAGDRYLVAEGGRGGHGNSRFLSNKRRAPAFAEQGEHGEERWCDLELRLAADVALIGFPNVGKSTLISRVSAAKPKVADYPFTTLVPHLGVVRVGERAGRRDDATEFVMADVPGLIEGAAEGRGLGHEFLRHVERARVLCVLLDLSEPPTRPRTASSRCCCTSWPRTSTRSRTARAWSSARSATWRSTVRTRRGATSWSRPRAVTGWTRCSGASRPSSPTRAATRPPRAPRSRGSTAPAPSRSRCAASSRGASRSWAAPRCARSP